MTSNIKANEKEYEATRNISSRGNGSYRGRGFGRGIGKFVITCYWYGV